LDVGEAPRLAPSLSYCDQKSSEVHVVICERRINHYCLNPSETAVAAYHQETKIVRENFD